MNRAAHAQGRKLRPLPELVEMISDASNGLDALLELLTKAEHHVVFATTLRTLLEPIHKRLTDASGDLNDMRI